MCHVTGTVGNFLTAIKWFTSQNMAPFGFLELYKINTLTANYGIKQNQFTKLTPEPLRYEH